MRKEEINIKVELDENNVPENIYWEATDSDNKDVVPVKAIMLSVWDHNYGNTLNTNIWTKEMPLDEMKLFFYQTLLTMGDSFLRAAGNQPLETAVIEDLRDYCLHFADKMELNIRRS
ncbi:gliding motility protein GldC [Hufsiella ginkgonis]|uniref:Gliding motility protein GldC n=1 Tax=Hufsiella ginkgonis TaxID=2695274 RepID=A0A7K1XXC8_9SPHI|nr:gliding motility protein GldC [Hufsiella ginkgonis]MXV15602.1 gliding motility protein GldC [Hufsiella ginkgonis]